MMCDLQQSKSIRPNANAKASMLVSLDILEIGRISVFLLYAIATIGVIMGVYWEHEEFEVTKRKRGWLLLLLSLGAETFLTITLFGIDSEISQRQQKIIERQQSEIIALRKNGIARSIEVSAFAARLADSPLASVEIRYVVPCTDCESLSFWISEALKKANWSVSSITPIDPIDRNWVRVVGHLHAQSSGITVVVNSPDKISADRRTSSLAALMGALSQTLGFNFAGYDAAVMGGVDVSMPPDLIRVVIAPKA
jgi:hypothetical protein